MRKVVYGGAASLDMFLAREDGAVDWLIMDAEAMGLMAGMWDRFDVMVMGRKTWAVSIAQFSEEDLKRAKKEMGGMPSYVFSRTVEPGRRGAYEIVKDDPVEFVRELRSQPGKDIMVMGGGEIGSLLLDAGRWMRSGSMFIRSCWGRVCRRFGRCRGRSSWSCSSRR